MKFFKLILLFIFASANLSAAQILPFAEKTNYTSGSPTQSPHGSPTKKENVAYGARFKSSPVKKPNAISQEAKDSCKNRLFPDHDSNTEETLVLFMTAPHDQPNRGDTDYVQSVMKSLEGAKPKIKTLYVKNDCQINRNDLYNIEEMYDSKKHKKPTYQIEESEERKQAVKNIIEYVNLIKKSPTILHLQLRAPETGCLFFESDLISLKNEIKKLVITCHEWCHGHDKLREQQMAFFKIADHVIFLNQNDQQKAIDYVTQKNACSSSSTSAQNACQPSFDLAKFSSYSNITQTVPTKISAKDANTKPNILVFGLIRECKGFEEAVLLARAIKDLPEDHPLHDARIKIAGKPSDRNLLVHLIKATYGLDKDQNFQPNLIKNFNSATSEQKCKIFLKELEGSSLSPEKQNDIKKKFSNNSSISGYKSSPSPYKEAFVKANSYVASTQESEKFHIQAALDWLRANEEKIKVLPVDFYFDIDIQQLDKLAQECKFCLKIEEKGFANNSSSIINALHRLLIVFTNQGELTSADFLKDGKYAKAIILVDKNDKSLMINGIIEEMANIENDSSEFENRISAIKSCIENLFSDKKVANDHLEIYQKLLQQ